MKKTIKKKTARRPRTKAKKSTVRKSRPVRASAPAKRAPKKIVATTRPEEPPKEKGIELQDDVVLEYQRYRVGAALPWDHERHAVNEPWAKLSQDIGPRDSGRGTRSGF